MNIDQLTEAFGKALREIRKEKGMSQNDLIKASDLDRTTVQRYDAGKRLPVIKNLVIISEALKVSPAEIVDRAYKYYKEM